MSPSARARGLAITAAALVAGGHAHADGMGRGVGAMRGAIIGDLIGGGHGAAAGAAIGAMIGAPGADERKQQQLDGTQAELDAKLAQWDADQRARELAAVESREQAARQAGAGSGVDDLLLIETQRTLIALGYDPGPVGIQSPELTTAIVRYQEDAGLLPNGAMSTELLDRMITDSLTR